MNTQYKMLVSDVAINLTRVVQNHLNDGWELYGDAFSGPTSCVYQPVIRQGNSIEVLKEGEQGPTGQHLRLSWKNLELLLRGEVELPLMGENERIIAITKQDDNGIVVCIGERK